MKPRDPYEILGCREIMNRIENALKQRRTVKNSKKIDAFRMRMIDGESRDDVADVFGYASRPSTINEWVAEICKILCPELPHLEDLI